MKTTDGRAREGFTGLHMLAIMVAFFGVIIAVNVTMAVTASTSWTGLVVRNSYVASQEFNHKAQEARAQAALGWNSTLTISNGLVRYALADAGGKPRPVHGGSVTLRRPVNDLEDRTVGLAAVQDGVLEGRLTVADGVWIVEVLVDAGLERPYRETHRLTMRGGVVR